MEKALRRYGAEPAGIVLALAWQAGLQRREIYELTWSEVDFENALLRLPDREVPIEEGTAEILLRWKRRCERFGSYVAVSDRLRKRVAEASISRLARTALDAFGQTEVRLQDLRYDYILRQFRVHDWPYVLRVAGISLSTYRAQLAKVVRELPPGTLPTLPPAEEDDVGEEFKLWRIMQTERSTPAGIALWLSSQLGLQSEEIARLTWDNVDFDAGVLRLPDRELPLKVGVGNVLREERARRGPEDDPHILLTPRSRRPVEPGRLTTIVRDALIRGGIENRTLQDFRRDTAWEAERAAVRDYLAGHGSISREELARLLSLSEGQAYVRLTRLAEEGEVALRGTRWYPAEDVIAAADRADAVLRHMSRHGAMTRGEIEAMLRVSRPTAAALIRDLTEAGELARVPGTWKYAATKSYNDTDESRIVQIDLAEKEPFVAVKSHIKQNT